MAAGERQGIQRGGPGAEHSRWAGSWRSSEKIASAILSGQATPRLSSAHDESSALSSSRRLGHGQRAKVQALFLAIRVCAHLQGQIARERSRGSWSSLPDRRLARRPPALPAWLSVRWPVRVKWLASISWLQKELGVVERASDRFDGLFLFRLPSAGHVRAPSPPLPSALHHTRPTSSSYPSRCLTSSRSTLL